jgi:hypothetical protein
MVISNTYTAIANALSANVLAGETFEFVPGRRAMIRLRISAAATGVRANLQIGGESVLQDALCSNSNRFPVAPDDVLVDGVGAAGGERLFLTFRNSTGGNIVVNFVVDIQPF